MQEAQIFFACGLKYFPTPPILSKRHLPRQITGSRNFGNLLSGN